jgi:hypothetical protein
LEADAPGDSVMSLLEGIADGFAAVGVGWEERRSVDGSKWGVTGAVQQGKRLTAVAVLPVGAHADNAAIAGGWLDTDGGQ